MLYSSGAALGGRRYADQDPNAFACGRCFCLVLATNANAQTSTLYNMSFCLVPTPAHESTLALPGLANSLHSAEGEGDGGNGFTIFIDTKVSPQTYHVMLVAGTKITKRVDISAFVDEFGGNVYPGGTAFCAETQTMWVAIQTRHPSHDTLLTVDLASNKVVANVSIVKPALGAHFADCSTNSAGGVTLHSTGPVTNVVLGMLDAASAFTEIDSHPLPADTNL
jgi:hypothetical protein